MCGREVISSFKGCLHLWIVSTQILKYVYSETPQNWTPTGPRKLFCLEEIPVLRGYI